MESNTIYLAPILSPGTMPVIHIHSQSSIYEIICVAPLLSQVQGRIVINVAPMFQHSELSGDGTITSAKGT